MEGFGFRVEGFGRNPACVGSVLGGFCGGDKNPINEDSGGITGLRGARFKLGRLATGPA